MSVITEHQIRFLAVNAASLEKGRTISQRGEVISLARSKDGTFYLGQCQGSGKKPYVVSADLYVPEQPVLTCSCPSRQYPCKHAIALLFEIEANKPCSEIEIPEKVLQKRAKAEMKANPEGASSVAVKKAPRKASTTAAQKKKMQKQLEGIALCEKMLHEVMQAGLGSLGGTSLQSYQEVTEQLGNYYLPGLQRLAKGFLRFGQQWQEKGSVQDHGQMLSLLEKMWDLIKKSRQYLQNKIDANQEIFDDNILYEALGGIWKFSDLERIGLSKANVRLIQLGFWVYDDIVREERIDTGCWIDIDSGEVCMSYTYRPFKALKRMKEEDSCFSCLESPQVVFYPGTGNRRVRWEAFRLNPIQPQEIAAIMAFAAPNLASSLKAAKNLLKNPLSEPVFFGLVRFRSLGRTDSGLVLVDTDGQSIHLADAPTLEESCLHLESVMDAQYVTNQVMLAGFWYDSVNERIKAHPVSIITPERILRLLY